MTEFIANELAQSLHESVYDPGYMNSVSVVVQEVEGLQLVHPFSRLGQSLTQLMAVGPVDYACYVAGQELMNPETMPQDWKAFFREVKQAQQTTGTTTHINFLMMFSLLEYQDPTYAQSSLRKLKPLPGSIWPDIRDLDATRGVVNDALSDPIIRQKLLRQMATYVPPMSPDGMYATPVLRAIERLKLHGGILLDIGCGLGNKTEEWQSQSGMRTIGLDRQYLGEWLGKIWYPRNENLTYAQADLGRALPLRDRSISVAILDTVVEYLERDRLTAGLEELNRVLISGGILAVAPQEVEEMWRIFINRQPITNRPSQFIEYSISA